jgi:hypothetical protein
LLYLDSSSGNQKLDQFLALQQFWRARENSSGCQSFGN